MTKKNLIEGVDYYFEEKDSIKYKVFTEKYHKERGFCCKNNCKHCVYNFKKSIKDGTNKS